jgi:hypothetical protein
MNQSQKISWMKNVSNTQQTTKYTKKQANSTLMMNESQKMSWMKKNMSNTRNNKTKKQTESTYTEKKQFVTS